ncbi:hypothetical protein llap_10708 [Limosa lapponica baueri]|uniref:Uncharacterized protein n=1 Tax=Limosa lapponica baueri TaxID=1758121 RepID=A0A2I0TYT6_LIMLA|nr:hypothetical protein llap_10708 [Limosa lapponica baueri]
MALPKFKRLIFHYYNKQERVDLTGNQRTTKTGPWTGIASSKTALFLQKYLQAQLLFHSMVPGSSFIISVLDGVGVTRTRYILDPSLQISVDSPLLTFHVGPSMLPSPEVGPSFSFSFQSKDLPPKSFTLVEDNKIQEARAKQRAVTCSKDCEAPGSRVPD